MNPQTTTPAWQGWGRVNQKEGGYCMNSPDRMEKANRLLVLLGRIVFLAAQVLSPFDKFHN